MRAPASTRLIAAASLALLLALSTASVASAEPSPEASTASAEPAAAAAQPAEAWSYSSYYIYPLTRHIDESAVSKNWRYAVYPFTAILDTAQLPLGAIAGLFGS